MTGNWLLGIPEGSENVDAALDFILWFTAPEQQKRLLLDQNIPATRISVLEDPEAVEKFPFLPGLLAAGRNAVPRPRTEHYNAAEAIYGRYVAEAIAGQITGEEAMNKSNQEIRDLMVREGRSGVVRLRSLVTLTLPLSQRTGRGDLQSGPYSRSLRCESQGVSLWQSRQQISNNLRSEPSHALVGAQSGVAARRADAPHVRRLRLHSRRSRRFSTPSATSSSTAAACSGRSSVSTISRAHSTIRSFGSRRGTTLKWALMVTVVEILLGLGLALLLAHGIRGRAHLHLAADHPDHHAAGRGLADVVFHVRVHLRHLQLSAELDRHLPPCGGSRIPNIALYAMMAVDVWQATPFAFLLLYAAILSLPRDPYEAAAIDGAGRWHVFRTVTLPLLLPVLAVVVLLRLIDAARIFDKIFVMTRGGPGSSAYTTTLDDLRRRVQQVRLRLRLGALVPLPDRARDHRHHLRQASHGRLLGAARVVRRFSAALARVELSEETGWSANHHSSASRSRSSW